MKPMKFTFLSAAALLLCGAAVANAQSAPRPEPIAGAGETVIADEIKQNIKAEPKTSTADAPRVIVVQTGESAPVQDPYKKANRMWKISLATLIGANGLDVISSWGKHEANPLLKSSDGTFGMRGLALKSGIVGASLTPQLLLRNHKEMHKTFAVINFAETAFFSAVAMHNFNLPAPKIVK